MAGSSHAMSLDSIPVYPSDSGIRLDDSASLTDDWPSDVPVYPGLKMLYSANMKGSIAIQATSNDTQSKVAGFYKVHTAVAGWAEETTIAEKQMVLQSFVKNKRKLSIVITEHEGGALVALTFING
ncbi:MAG: hypothetical protein IT366_00975 [Candidatus Hydrogenedentes bacterium]|nr:hypothetical protein [Candidatus Hydrogenedentota bacterium]